MKNKISRIKIVICTAFVVLCGAAFFLPSVVRISGVQTVANDVENPQSCAACHRGEFDARHRIILKRAAAENAAGGAGVSCAECHGNAAEHLAAKTSVWARFGFPSENKIINPRDLSSDAAMMICARCHAAGESNDAPAANRLAAAEYVDEFVAAHRQNDSDAEKLWADGSPKFGGNEYRAVLRSVCYAQSKAGGHGIAGEKINCSSCHSPHEANDDFAATEKSFDQSCLQCHAQFSERAAIAEHTKHPLDSKASRCASCHQPETVFSRTRFTRTHEIGVPNPVLTAEKQIPNACNLCHADQSVNWAIASSKKLWAERFRDSEISPDAQFDRPEGIRALSSNDAFLRALAADSLRKHSDLSWSEPFLFAAYQIEKSPPVERFLAAALRAKNANSKQTR